VPRADTARFNAGPAGYTLEGVEGGSQRRRGELSGSRRLDPIFGRETPLLFAHRGGKLEVPENTPLAFDHALHTARADVLEIDVQRSADGKIVVWHGPSLENVRIDGFDDRPARRARWQRKVTTVEWSVLQGARVADPRKKYEDLSDVPDDPARRLLRLSEFLDLYPSSPVNVEVKTDNFGTEHVPALLDQIHAGRRDRPILVVSQSRSLLETYRRLARERFPAERSPTGLSAGEVLAERLRSGLRFVRGGSLQDRAVQTTHHAFLTPDRFVRDVRGRGGALHVFITGLLLLPALDAKAGHPTRKKLEPLLERGVDGIMTDRPAQVRPLLDAWKRSTPLG
jgi:glycerophosphoryl diester phosphodiesterase